MSNSEFLLPDELGWECNDKISEMIFSKLMKMGELGAKIDDDNHRHALVKIGIAEIMDETYKIIKEYQAKKS